MTAASRRRCASPIRLTLAATLGEGVDGAWWLRTSSLPGELPELIDALLDRLGHINGIEVNWSSSEGVPDLDMRTRRGMAALPGWKERPQRVMTVTGSRAHTNLLVVPAHTTAALAVMVLRHAAGLDVEARHYDSTTYLAAFDIVSTARAECARRGVAASATTADD